MGLRMKTKNGVEFEIGKSENDTMMVYVGCEVLEITSFIPIGENIEIKYEKSENFDVSLINDIVTAILDQPTTWVPYDS